MADATGELTSALTEIVKRHSPQQPISVVATLAALRKLFPKVSVDMVEVLLINTAAVHDRTVLFDAKSNRTRR